MQCTLFAGVALQKSWQHLDLAASMKARISSRHESHHKAAVLQKINKGKACVPQSIKGEMVHRMLVCLSLHHVTSVATLRDQTIGCM